MSNIFSGIQQFFINVITVITSAILVISPFDKPQPQPSPTPTVIQEVQEASPSAKVLGVTEAPKDNKEIKNTKPKEVTLLTPIPSTLNVQSSNPTPAPLITNTPVAQIIKQVTKTDYSSYRLALQATLDSLKNRLYTIQTQADQTPQDVDSQINSINTSLASDLLVLENAYNQSTTNLTREFAFRGISPSSGMFQDELRSLTDSYNNSRNSLISQADQDKQQVYANAKNKIYQADAQDKDLSNKIKVVEGLINKIISGTFTDSDIPLAIQAIYY